MSALINYYSTPSIERPLPPETTSNYRPEVTCMDALNRKNLPLATDHPLNVTSGQKMSHEPHHCVNCACKIYSTLFLTQQFAMTASARKRKILTLEGRVAALKKVNIGKSYRWVANRRD